jgi:hypothetical protein
MRGGLRVLVLAIVATTGACHLALADEPSPYLYGVLRRPTDLKVTKKTSLQSSRVPTQVQPKLRKTYAYGWFGAQSYPQAEAQRGYRNMKTRWVWK